MTTYPGATTTVTLTATVPTNIADAAGLAAEDRANGTVLLLRHEDAVELVTADMARFGSAALDADTSPTNPARTGRIMPAVIRSQAGTAYTLAATDAGCLVEATAATPVTVTVPLNAVVPFKVGTTIDLRQYGAGLVTVAAAAGVTIRSKAGALKLDGQYTAAKLVKRGTDEWWLSGSIVV